MQLIWHDTYAKDVADRSLHFARCEIRNYTNHPILELFLISFKELYQPYACNMCKELSTMTVRHFMWIWARVTMSIARHEQDYLESIESLILLHQNIALGHLIDIIASARPSTAAAKLHRIKQHREWEYMSVISRQRLLKMWFQTSQVLDIFQKCYYACHVPLTRLWLGHLDILGLLGQPNAYSHDQNFLIIIGNQLNIKMLLTTLRPRQNGRHFADDIFKCIFSNENVWI